MRPYDYAYPTLCIHPEWVPERDLTLPPPWARGRGRSEDSVPAQVLSPISTVSLWFLFAVRKCFSI